MWSSETKLSCIKTELKRCTMTESLWNRYDISHKSPEVPVRRSPKRGEEGQRSDTERTVGFHCDWLKNIRVCEARIFRLFTTGIEVCCGAGRPSRRRQLLLLSSAF